MSKKNYTNYSKPETMNIPEFDESLNDVIEENVAMNETSEEVEDVSGVEEIVEEDVPEVKEESLDTISKPNCSGFVDNCESLRIRQVPNPVGEILTTISSGTEVEIDLNNSTNDFYKVCTATGLDGYCMKKFITLR